ncbi:MAG: NFACT RNA binding domain-containing protein [Candidatus Micrarchaeia archaeon]
MKIELDFSKNARANAADYYDSAKKFRKKAAGAAEALKKTRRAGLVVREAPAKAKKQKRKWFGEFHYFTATGGFLVVAGKDAKQNELLVAKHLTDADLFFHADVVGASTTILKNGLRAPAAAKEEAAQWACCYSRAWKTGLGSADAYCVPKAQVSKHSHGEFVGKGAFMITGEREWFTNTPLELRVCLDAENEVLAEPMRKPGKGTVLRPDGTAKDEVIGRLKKRFPKAALDALAFAVPGASAVQGE